MPIGTSITVLVSSESIRRMLEKAWGRCADWYGLADPRVLFRARKAEMIDSLKQTVSITESELQGNATDWNCFRPEGFTSVSWMNNTKLNYGQVESSEDRFERQYRRAMERERRRYYDADYEPEDEYITNMGIPRVYCNGFLIGVPPWIVPLSVV
jgi:hypothetical protein